MSIDIVTVVVARVIRNLALDLASDWNCKVTLRGSSGIVRLRGCRKRRHRYYFGGNRLQVVIVFTMITSKHTIVARIKFMGALVSMSIKIAPFMSKAVPVLMYVPVSISMSMVAIRMRMLENMILTMCMMVGLLIGWLLRR